MKLVHELLRQKPLGVASIAPNATVLEAIRLLAERNIGAVPVMDGLRLVGIFSERDYVRRCAQVEAESRARVADLPVSDMMTRKVLCVTPSDSSEHCMQLMTQKKVRHLPVLADKEVIGILSIGDLVKDLIEEQRETIKQLEAYIHQ